MGESGAAACYVIVGCAARACGAGRPCRRAPRAPGSVPSTPLAMGPVRAQEADAQARRSSAARASRQGAGLRHDHRQPAELSACGARPQPRPPAVCPGSPASARHAWASACKVVEGPHAGRLCGRYVVGALRPASRPSIRPAARATNCCLSACAAAGFRGVSARRVVGWMVLQRHRHS